MPKYKVFATYMVEVSHEIEAESQDSAWDMVHNIDGGDYTETGWSDWQIDRIEEVKNELA